MSEENEQVVEESVDTGTTEEVFTSSEVQEAGSEATERPDYIEEKFWNKDDNNVNVEAMAKSYKDLQTAYLKKTDTLKEEAAADFAKERTANRPETSGHYEVRIPEDVLPEGVEFKMVENDPLLAEFRTLAFDNGLTQDQFDGIIGKYALSELAKMPNQASELKALGERGLERTERVNAWLGAVDFPDGAMNAAHAIAQTKDGIVFLETIMAKATGDSAGLSDTPTIPEHVDNREEFEAKTKEMMLDPEYQKYGSYYHDVQQRWQKLYPGTSATATQNRM
jgi:hypothetical protein